MWEVDPLKCEKCGSEMKVIAVITQREVITKVLSRLYSNNNSADKRAPPLENQSVVVDEVESIPFDDG